MQREVESGLEDDEDDEESETHILPVARRGCCQRLTERLRLVERGATPPNWKYIFLMFISLFSSAFSLTYTFPFLPDMMLSFGYPEEKKGYFVGLVASCVFAGRAVGSFFWGWLSDIKGRRLVLLVTIFGNGLLILLFGFATNLPMAMILRFLTGLVNGTVGTAKTVLYEVSDNTNQALGMTTISLAGGFGLILGPFLGGFLASPARKFPTVFSSDGFFGHFPFFLPSFVGFWVCMLVLVVVFFKFEETLIVRNVKQSAKVAEPSSETSRSSLLRVPSVASSPESAADVAVAFDSKTQHVDFLKTESNYSPTVVPSLSSTSQPLLSSRNEDTGESDTGYFNVQSCNITSDPRAASEDGAADSWNLEEVSLEGGRGNDPAGMLQECDGHGVQGEMRREHEMFSHKRVMRQSASPSTCSMAGYGSHCEENSSDDDWDSGTESSALLRPNSQCAEKMKKTSGRCQQKYAAHVQRETISSKWSGCFVRIRQSRPFMLIRDPDVLKAVGLYTFFSFAVIGYEDVFTVWASTKTWLDGLGFTSEEIGVALGSLAIPMLLLQIKLFPMLTQRYGIIKAFLICDVVLLITIQVTPTLHLLAHRKVLLWVLLMAVVIPNKMASSSCYAATSLLVNNSVTTENAGTVNGIAMTTTAIARTFAPTIGGSIFAWTVSFGSDNIGAPFDVSLAFFFMGLAVFATLIAAIFMPQRLNSQKKPAEFSVECPDSPQEER